MPQNPMVQSGERAPFFWTTHNIASENNFHQRKPATGTGLGQTDAQMRGNLVDQIASEKSKRQKTSKTGGGQGISTVPTRRTIAGGTSSNSMTLRRLVQGLLKACIQTRQIIFSCPFRTGKKGPQRNKDTMIMLSAENRHQRSSRRKPTESPKLPGNQVRRRKGKT